MSEHECVACGAPCPPGRRWCSMGCFVAEDGYPDTDCELEDDPAGPPGADHPK